MTSSKKAKAVLVKKHLKLAKADIAAGEASFRSAAKHIAAAIEAGATQTEVAALVGKSQPWVSRLLKWQDDGFKGLPLGHYYPGNNAAADQPKTRYVTVQVTHKSTEIAAPYYVTKTDEQPTQDNIVPLRVTRGEPLGEVTRGYDVGEVTRGNEPRLPLNLWRDLEQLEKLAADFSINVLQLGGISAQAEQRIRAVADRLLALIEQEAATTFDASQDSSVQH